MTSLVPPLRLAACTALAFVLGVCGTPVGLSAEHAQRIVSLAPSITETLFAIGAGDRLVGVSDYCALPAGVADLPRTGSSLAPRYEAIARLRPTLIVTERIVHGLQGDLDRIAPTRELPWLATDDVIASTRELGRLTEHAAESERLAARFAALQVAPPPGAPRVLLVLGASASSTEDVGFIRRNSLHGAALAAAGGRNAVDEDVLGVPRLGLERLLRLDPDMLIVLSLQGEGESVLEPWRRLTPLRAVRDGRIAVVPTRVLTNGPSVLDLKDRLAVVITRLLKAP